MAQEGIDQSKLDEKSLSQAPEEAIIQHIKDETKQTLERLDEECPEVEQSFKDSCGSLEILSAAIESLGYKIESRDGSGFEQGSPEAKIQAAEVEADLSIIKYRLAVLGRAVRKYDDDGRLKDSDDDSDGGFDGFPRCDPKPKDAPLEARLYMEYLQVLEVLVSKIDRKLDAKQT